MIFTFINKKCNLRFNKISYFLKIDKYLFENKY